MGIEFNENIGNLFGASAPKRTQKSGKAKEVSQPVPVGQPQTKEIGRDLLNQLTPTFVKTEQISKTDAANYTLMCKMAGIENPKLPTATQFGRIRKDALYIAEDINEFFA